MQWVGPFGESAVSIIHWKLDDHLSAEEATERLLADNVPSLGWQGLWGLVPPPYSHPHLPIPALVFLQLLHTSGRF